MNWSDYFSDESFVANLKGLAETIYDVNGDEAVNETYLRCLKLSNEKKRINKQFIRGVLYNYCRDVRKITGKESEIFQHIRTHELIPDNSLEMTTDLERYGKMEILLNKILHEEIDSELLLRALTGESIQALSVEYDVPYATLRKRVSRFRMYLNDKYGNNMFLRLKGIKDEKD